MIAFQIKCRRSLSRFRAIIKEPQIQRHNTTDKQCSAVNSKRARVAVRKLKTINHACVSHRRPMNIYENHCVVYRPINPGVKIFQSSVVFYRSLLRGSSVPSGGTEMRGSRGKEGGGNVRREGARGKKDAVISPIDHPTREPTPFLDPLHAARSLADRI